MKGRNALGLPCASNADPMSLRNRLHLTVMARGLDSSHAVVHEHAH